MIKCDLHSLFHEARALQEKLLKSKLKRETDEYKELNRHMATGIISNTIRCLTDKFKGGILSIDETVKKNGSTKTVYENLIEKHPVANLQMRHISLPRKA